MNIWYWLWGISILPSVWACLSLLLSRLFLGKPLYKFWKLWLVAALLLITLRITLTATILVIEGSVLDYLSLLALQALIIVFSWRNTVR